jgi:hypothetical protein
MSYQFVPVCILLDESMPHESDKIRMYPGNSSGNCDIKSCSCDGKIMEFPFLFGVFSLTLSNIIEYMLVMGLLGNIMFYGCVTAVVSCGPSTAKHRLFLDMCAIEILITYRLINNVRVVVHILRKSQNIGSSVQQNKLLPTLPVTYIWEAWHVWEER